MSAPSISIREYRPGDEASIVDCMRRVFGAGTPEGRERTLEHWQWEFAKNPTGLWRILVAVDDAAGGKVVGQYAGVPIRMFDRGRVTIATQGVDSMVDPAYRGGLKRPGLFATLGMEWESRFVRSDVDPLLYGIPVPVAWRIGNAFLRYEVVRTQPVLYREPLSPLARGRGVEIVELE
ncbi:MAG TPA: GNAT family N-acetyltransferase, partial [Planctomycetota bacterium]|nr:GNAT family N-acetyltransferase [Planctomycetota bacterium]